MTWSDFYLLCFLVGFSLSVLSFMAGAVHIHLPFKMHFPFHGGHHFGHGGGVSHGVLRGGLKAGLKSGSPGGAHISWFNASTAMAFLAWFGGTGYLLSRHSRLLGLLILAISIVSGLFASWVVFRFMLKLVQSTDEPMRSEDSRVEGSVGTISMPIREKGGIGEIIFSLNGVRRSAGARCEDGQAIEKGAEVVVERYDRGIAYVKRWEEFTK